MIASVLATLIKDGGSYQGTIDEIASIPYVEVGAVDGHEYRVPVTIDSPAADVLEETTRLIQSCRGVAFVDVVFVHFEENSAVESAACEGTTAPSKKDKVKNVN